MGNDDNQNRERDVRDRIASFMQADGQARHKEIPEDDVQTLSAAAGRLDQLLADVAESEQVRSKQATEEDLQALRAVAGRLDQLLTSIGVTGKTVVTELTPPPRRKCLNEMLSRHRGLMQMSQVLLNPRA